MKLIVSVLLLFALPHHSRAIGKCTGFFKENDPSNSGNGKQRPPAGTKCVEDCVLKSGRWGSSYCFTAKDKSQWGGECLDCSIFPVAAPEFFSDDAIADYFYANQMVSNGAKVSDGVLHLPNHRFGDAEIVIANLLQETLKMYDSRFIQGVSGYWTFHIWLARKNSGSAFHSYAKSLPTGIQTIKRRLSAHLMASNVASWSDVAEKKVIVY